MSEKLANGIEYSELQIVDAPCNNLSISREDNEFIFLFIPDVNETDHYHIDMSKLDAMRLRDWLNKELTDDVTITDLQCGIHILDLDDINKMEIPKSRMLMSKKTLQKLGIHIDMEA